LFQGCNIFLKTGRNLCESRTEHKFMCNWVLVINVYRMGNGSVVLLCDIRP
jgi:hypothetical protein